MSNIIIGKIIILLLMVYAVFLYADNKDSKVRVYDCGMAEWHPDIPKEVKEECRKLRRSTST